MFNRFIIIVIIISSGVLYAQKKYFVYFKDKGAIKQNSLLKASSAVFSGVKHLSEKSIERRKKVMGEESYINYDDISVLCSYTDQLVISGIKIDKTLNWFNAVSCYLNSTQYEKVKAFSFVDRIEPVRSLDVKQEEKSGLNFLSSPPGSYLGTASFNYGPSINQNALSDVPKVHDAGFDGTGVLIGILDTGFELSSQALSHIKLIAQHDFIFNDDITSNQTGDTLTQHYHGTAVLSIMAGFYSRVLIGPAFNANFLLAKTEDVRSEKHVEEDNYVAALEWMEAKGVQIASSSLAYATFDKSESSYIYANMDGKTAVVTKAAEKAFERGVVTLTAAGNDAALPWHYISAPGDGINTITVGSVTNENVVSAFSSKGPSYDGRIKPDICAMGEIVALYDAVSGAYNGGAGTSFSTPMAAGITALLLQAHPYLTNVQVRSIILQAGDNFKTPDNNRGYGLLSATRALNFPNLKKVNDVYLLNKMLIGVKGVVSGSVKFNYSVNQGALNSVDMVYDGVNRYSVSIPVLTNGDEIRFTFSYGTSSGSVTEPETNYYKFNYGGMQVLDKAFGGIVSNENNGSEIPVQYSLLQNYPNPFNPATVINYKITKPGMVRLKVYDMLGREVTTLVNEEKSTGSFSVNFNASKLASGIYYYQLQMSGFIETKKMVLMK